MTAADKPDVAPCGTQDALTSAADFGTLKTAMTTGTITYLDIPFDGADPDIYSRDGRHVNARGHAIAAAEALALLSARSGAFLVPPVRVPTTV